MLVDECQRGWALRYIREARAELEAAKNIPKAASNSIYEALRKARMAIFYVLGEPDIVESVVQEVIVNDDGQGNALIGFLSDLNDIILQLEEAHELPEPQKETVFRKIGAIIESAEYIVGLFLKENID